MGLSYHPLSVPVLIFVTHLHQALLRTRLINEHILLLGPISSCFLYFIEHVNKNIINSKTECKLSRELCRSPLTTTVYVCVTVRGAETLTADLCLLGSAAVCGAAGHCTCMWPLLAPSFGPSLSQIVRSNMVHSWQ